jgi:formylglycine-generating enzyme required for sulfatase activity
MGSNDGLNDELPAHTVALAAFETDRLQVTHVEFSEVLERKAATRGKARRSASSSAYPLWSITISVPGARVSVYALPPTGANKDACTKSCPDHRRRIRHGCRDRPTTR